jgi:hypothetical protein
VLASFKGQRFTIGFLGRWLLKDNSEVRQPIKQIRFEYSTARKAFAFAFAFHKSFIISVAYHRHKKQVLMDDYKAYNDEDNQEGKQSAIIVTS